MSKAAQRRASACRSRSAPGAGGSCRDGARSAGDCLQRAKKDYRPWRHSSISQSVRANCLACRHHQWAAHPDRDNLTLLLAYGSDGHAACSCLLCFVADCSDRHVSMILSWRSFRDGEHRYPQRRANRGFGDLRYDRIIVWCRGANSMLPREPARGQVTDLFNLPAKMTLRYPK
jgi:hypothetical protein